MPSLLDTIRKALKASSPTLQQLGDAVTMSRKAEAQARAEVERQVKLVADGFMSDDATRAAARATLAQAHAVAEDAELVLAEAERRHAAALAASEQARRQAVYAGAVERADAAAAALTKSYLGLCRDLVGVLKTLAEAQLAVAAANCELPDGAVAIVDPEMAARAVPGRPREVVREAIVELWSRLDQDVPIQVQADIYDCGNGWGKRPGDAQAAFRLRRFQKVEYRELENGSFPPPLAVALRLPVLRGEGYLWGSAPVLGFDILAAAAGRGEGEPGAVLGRVAEIEAAAIAKPAKVERPIKTEWEMLGDVEPLPTGPAPSYSAEPSRRSPANVSNRPSQPLAAPAGVGGR